MVLSVPVGEATGWDWIGINLDDGGALMAFRMRDRRGGQYWAGGSLRGLRDALTFSSRRGALHPCT
jgi:predicted secreted hydrolase